MKARNYMSYKLWNPWQAQAPFSTPNPVPSVWHGARNLPKDKEHPLMTQERGVAQGPP